MEREITIREILQRLDGEDLSPEARRTVLEKVKGSSEARKALMEKNPSAIFSLLSLQKKDEDFWKGFWPGISDNLTVRSYRRKLNFSFAGTYRTALAACMILLLAAFGFYFLLDGRQPTELQVVKDMSFLPPEADRFSDVPLLENIEPSEALILDLGIIDEENKTHLYHFTNVDIDI